ncbi:MAG: molybdopterin-dependent oxidoreductase, partial [Pseudomonadales bacterium]|nr:molybdopterin-dependent oxidoreductase [Pseudomonadales bacterium]
MKFESVSRRVFLKCTGVTTSSLFIYSAVGCTSQAAQSFNAADLVSAWLYLAIEGEQFKLILPRSEMGQDVITSFSMIVADEMDFPLDRVVIQFADADSALGQQMTVGSSSISLWWNRMRQVGAYVRASVIAEAANQFLVDSAGCVIDDGVVYHLASQQQADYVALLKQKSLANYQGPVVLKSTQEFSIIGHDIKSRMVKTKVEGSFKYVGDLADAESVKAAVVAYRPDWPTPSDLELAAIKESYGLVDVFRLDGGLAGFTTRVVLLS